MAHLNIYLPDDVAASLRSQAANARVPLSRYVMSLVSDRSGGNGWPEGYFQTACGFLTEDLAEPPDFVPEPVDIGEL